MVLFLEQGTGIEPAFTAWEAVVLPIYEPCGDGGIIAEPDGKFNTFLSAFFGGIIQNAGKKGAVWEITPFPGADCSKKAGIRRI